MKRYIGMCVAVVLVLGVAMTAIGGEGDARKETQTKTGVVKKVDLAAQTIVVMVARELTFTIAADTKILQGDATKALADIKVGDTVTVEYSIASKDKRVASKVTIAAAAPVKAGAPAP